MDKQLILAVAGSGKTTYLINQLNEKSRFLIITYTQANLRNLRISVLSKFGYIPKNIEIYSYYTFLYSFCFAPFLSYQFKAKGLIFDYPPKRTRTFSRNGNIYYQSNDGRIYSNRLAELIINYNITSQIIDRLEKYYDNIFIDEIQDFACYDFALMELLSVANLNLLFVGDYYQHTYNTSINGSKNKNLHKNYEKYVLRFKKLGFTIDKINLSNSWRCSSDVCNFIKTNLHINIQSHRNDKTEIIIITNQREAKQIFDNDNIVKLFYQNSSKFPGFTKNWGDSKGENCYTDVCVILNTTSYNLFKKSELYNLTPSTKNKLYVALSRTKNNLYLIPDKFIKNYKLENV